jgi:hypothetical protein
MNTYLSYPPGSYVWIGKAHLFVNITGNYHGTIDGLALVRSTGYDPGYVIWISVITGIYKNIRYHIYIEGSDIRYVSDDEAVLILLGQ